MSNIDQDGILSGPSSGPFLLLLLLLCDFNRHVAEAYVDQTICLLSFLGSFVIILKNYNSHNSKKFLDLGQVLSFKNNNCQHFRKSPGLWADVIF